MNKRTRDVRDYDPPCPDVTNYIVQLACTNDWKTWTNCVRVCKYWNYIYRFERVFTRFQLFKSVAVKSPKLTNPKLMKNLWKLEQSQILQTQESNIQNYSPYWKGRTDPTPFLTDLKFIRLALNSEYNSKYGVENEAWDEFRKRVWLHFSKNPKNWTSPSFLKDIEQGNSYWKELNSYFEKCKNIVYPLFSFDGQGNVVFTVMWSETISIWIWLMMVNLSEIYNRNNVPCHLIRGRNIVDESISRIFGKKKVKSYWCCLKIPKIDVDRGILNIHQDAFDGLNATNVFSSLPFDPRLWKQILFQTDFLFSKKDELQTLIAYQELWDQYCPHLDEKSFAENVKHFDWIQVFKSNCIECNVLDESLILSNLQEPWLCEKCRTLFG